MPKYVREIAVQGHQRPTFGACYGQDPIVACAHKFLIAGERNIVAGRPENGSYAVRDILIELH